MRVTSMPGLYALMTSSSEQRLDMGGTVLISVHPPAWLLESLSLNIVRYENDKLEAYMKKLTKK